jgi:demethylmenaquinone methyltransferase / 2-methoxy-6-polyprenyl-1,4-benzoquinol methylase
MLQHGFGKLMRSGWAGRGTLCLGDAAALPLADATFDGAVVAFGLRNVGARAQALAELRRVLRPAAPLVVLEFGLPRGVLGRAYAVYFEQVLPRIGAWVSGDGGAYSYLPRSVGRFPPVEDFAREMAEAGFDDVTWQRLTGGIAWLCRGVAPPLVLRRP